MLTAIVNGQSSLATPQAHGRRPSCHGEVTAKCGRIVVWHWAHLSGEDCDTCPEPHTVWHRNWQALFPLHPIEVPLGAHRADLLDNHGNVVEFQHSALSVDDIRAREAHYGLDMTWVFDAIDAYQRERFLPRWRPERNIWTFRWKHARKSIRACQRRVLLDLGGGRMFEIKRIYAETAPVGGWGLMYSTANVIHGLRWGNP